MILKNVRLLIGGIDLSRESNTVAIDSSRESKAADHLLSETRQFKPGLKTVALSSGGLAGQVSAGLEELAVESEVISVVLDAKDGAMAYSFLGGEGKCSVTHSVGELKTFDMEAYAEGCLKRLKVLGLREQQTSNLSHEPFMFEGGDLSLVLHLFDITGTATFTVEHDVTGDFNGSETAVYSFNDLTDIDGQMVTLADAAQGYYRLVVTLTDSGKTASYLVALNLK